jgi:hypothetical protein
MATHRFYNHRNDGRNGDDGVMNSQEADTLLASFPNTRLSYEASIHKNEQLVPGYKCFILPRGKRCVAWVTEWKRRKIVAVIDIAGSNHSGVSPILRKFQQENGWIPGSVRVYDACIDSSLAYGTVFGGVIFRLTDKTCFSIHTIYWYKGNPIPSLTLSGHVRLCETIFAEKEIRQVAYTKQKSVVFGLPVLCNSDQDAESIAQGLPYQVYAFQYRYNTHTKVFQRICDSTGRVYTKMPVVAAPVPVPAPTAAPSPSPAPARQIPYIPPTDEMLTNIQATFIVRPNIQNDIYELFVMPSRGREPQFHNFAHIPSYKTSVMMNRLFRNIAENQRLDALEESEDETEFENTEPDKYVSLHKEYIMACRFHKRFCRWVPFQVVPAGGAGAGVVTDQQVKQHEFRYLNSRRITHGKKSV